MGEPRKISLPRPAPAAAAVGRRHTANAAAATLATPTTLAAQNLRNALGLSKWKVLSGT